MANTTGWEILCPMAFTAEWNGGTHQDDITLITGPRRTRTSTTSSLATSATG